MYEKKSKCFAFYIYNLISLSHCGLVIPYGNIYLGQHSLRQWLVAWWHQTINWTNVDLSLNMLRGICLRAMSQEVLIKLICLSVFKDNTFKITAISPRRSMKLWYILRIYQWKLTIPSFLCLMNTYSNVHACTSLNSSPPSDGYIRQWIGWALVQIMVCRLFGAKPLSKPMLGYCQLDH